MSNRTFHISTSCQDLTCAEEMSYPIDMLRWWRGKPICEECFAEVPAADKLDPKSADGDTIYWHDLPSLRFEEARP